MTACRLFFISKEYFTTLNYNSANVWVEDMYDEDARTTTVMIPFSKNYQIYLNAYLAWQK